MEQDISGLQIPHGGTGGFKEPKPIPTPLEKLVKYTVESNMMLKDLFLIFDKERQGHLNEENFRAALKVRPQLLRVGSILLLQIHCD